MEERKLLMSLKEKRTVRIIGERNICLHLSNLNHRERIMRIGKALSSSTRLDILDMLKNTPRSLQEIASILDIPLSSAALHIKTLEEAKLIVTETQPGIRGSMRVCICSMQSFHLDTSLCSLLSIVLGLTVSPAAMAVPGPRTVMPHSSGSQLSGSAPTTAPASTWQFSPRMA